MIHLYVIKFILNATFSLIYIFDINQIKIMKLLFSFLVFTSVFLISCSSSSNINQNISGRITNNSEYKGGANPPEWLLDELAVFRPSANQIFHVRNLRSYEPFTRIITRFTTNENGEYSLSIPAGEYAVISQEKYEFEQNPYATRECEYLREPDFVLTITETQTNYTSQFTSKANYCLGYPQ